MAEKHFFEQRNHARQYLIPYFDRHLPRWRQMKILEVGCGEGGFLQVLAEMGVAVVGMELMPHRAQLMGQRMPHIEILVGDITKTKDCDRLPGPFDLIILRDVIEHVENRSALFRNIRPLLKDKGFLYITFPPRFSPFAGHQQNGRSLLRMVPFLHLMPPMFIRLAGKLFREYPHLIDAVITNRRIGLSIRRFEKLLSSFQFKPLVFELFLSRPVYRTRFGWKIRRFPNIPVVREFCSTGCEALLQKAS